MAVPRINRLFLKYSGNARYLQYFIHELQNQYDNSYTFDRNGGLYSASARVELNLPGMYIEQEIDSCPILEES